MIRQFDHLTICRVAFCPEREFWVERKSGKVAERPKGFLKQGECIDNNPGKTGPGNRAENISVQTGGVLDCV
jgi:hypothetical protein